VSYQKAAEKKIRQSQRVKEREAQLKRNVWFREQVSAASEEHRVFTKQAMQIYYTVDKYEGFINEIGKTFTLGLGKNDKDKPYTPRKVVDMMLDSFEWNVDQSFAIFGMPERAMDLKERGIKDVTILVIEDTPNCLAKMIAKALGYKYSTIKEIGMKKFDAVIANPPYDGKSKLFQEFFSAAVDKLTTATGVVVFITPATPMYTRKTNSHKHEARMRELVQTYHTDIMFVSDDVFGNITFTGLIITALHKSRKTNGHIASIQYTDGSKYSNVSINDINIIMMQHDIYSSIMKKKNEAITKFGSFGELAKKTKWTQEIGCYVQSIRGHPGEDDMFTIVSNNPAYYKQAEDGGMSIILPKEEWEFFYTYAKTFFARWCIATLKVDQNLGAGQLLSLPKIPMDRHWTDEELAQLIGLTDDEMNEIFRVLPDYHNLRGVKLDSFMEE
jgi:hypothetical protein